MADAKHNHGFEIALLALLAFLWGSSYLLIKIAVETIPPVTLIAIRVTIAALLLLAIVAWNGEHLPRDHQTWRRFFVQAVLNSIGAWTVLAWGQQYIDSGLASVLNSTSPIFVFFITLLITRHESTNAFKLLGACLGVAGVTLIVGVDVLKGLGQQIAAQGAVLLGALLYAGAAIYGKKFSHLSPTVTAAGTMIWASVCLVPLSLMTEQPWTLRPSAISLLAAIVLAITLHRRCLAHLLPTGPDAWFPRGCQSELPACRYRRPSRHSAPWRADHVCCRDRTCGSYLRCRGDQHAYGQTASGLTSARLDNRGSRCLSWRKSNGLQ